MLWICYKTQQSNSTVSLCNCSKISNIFLSLFLKEVLVIKVGIHKVHASKALDQTALEKSDLCLHCLSRNLFNQLVFEMLECLPYIRKPVGVCIIVFEAMPSKWSQFIKKNIPSIGFKKGLTT